MCGIVGYTGNKNAIPIIIESLERLAYRGYDSAGIALLTDSEMIVEKEKGKISILKKQLKTIENQDCKVGIGHSRWATHGIPSKENAHPHQDCSGKFSLVHNGIIENYINLKEELTADGHIFSSYTDTEVIIHLIEKFYEGDLVKAVRKTIKTLKGSYALAVIAKTEPDLIVAVRCDSPLIVGKGKGENFLASDVPAILPYTREIIYPLDKEIIKITSKSIGLFDIKGNKIERKTEHIDWDISQAQKDGYPHFMLKEINEQPLAVENTIRGRVKDNGEVVFSDLKLTADEINKAKKIVISSCGTAWHAALIGRYIIEEFARVSVEVDISSEFRYRNPIVDKDTLVILVSQSGETADTLAGLRAAKRKGAKVLSICNVVGSSIARESDGVIYTYAGPEIGVASTKAYSAQLVVFYLFAIYLGRMKGMIDDEKSIDYINKLKQIPFLIKKILSDSNTALECAQLYSDKEDFLYLGRGYNFPNALEGALKLKEISYIHAEGYAAGEMKHGPIALIDDKVPVVCITVKSKIYDKMVSNMQEIKARDGIVIAIATEKDEHICQYSDHVMYIPDIDEVFSPLLVVIPLQLLAYYVAVKRGCDVDQPRNLAKSVTVE